MNRVSVIIPTYNRGRYLRCAVESVAAQYYPDMEIIIVDDRSTDNTVDVVNGLKREFPGIVYRLNGRPQGPSGARNEGLLAATGDYISFLDSDDVWLEDHLSMGLSILANNPDTSVVFGNLIVADYHSKKHLFNFFDKKKVLVDLPALRLDDCTRLIEGNIFEALIQENFFHLGSSIVSRKVMKNVFFDERVTFAEDADFAIQLFMKNRARFVCRMNPTYIIYKHDENMTEVHRLDTKMQDAEILLFSEYLEKYAVNKFQKVLLKRKISEELLDRSYTWRSQGDYVRALVDLWKSTTRGARSAHIVEASKLMGSFVAKVLRNGSITVRKRT